MKTLDEYFSSDGYGKWLEIFEKACTAIHTKIQENANLSRDDVMQLLYESEDNKKDFFRSTKPRHFNGLVGNLLMNTALKIASKLEDFTKPMRKAYSDLKVVNSLLDKDNSIDSEVIKELYYFYINTIKAYRDISKIILSSIDTASSDSEDDDYHF